MGFGFKHNRNGSTDMCNKKTLITNIWNGFVKTVDGEMTIHLYPESCVTYEGEAFKRIDPDKVHGFKLFFCNNEIDVSDPDEWYAVDFREFKAEHTIDGLTDWYRHMHGKLMGISSCGNPSDEGCEEILVVHQSYHDLP